MKKSLIFLSLLISLILIVITYSEVKLGPTNQDNSTLIENDITLPKDVQKPAQFIFKINEEINLERFIILVSVFVMILVVFLNALKLSHFFENHKLIGFFVALAVSLLASQTGAIKISQEFLVNFLGSFNLDRINKIKVYIIIVFFIAVYIIIYNFIGYIKEKRKLEKAEDFGKALKEKAFFSKDPSGYSEFEKSGL